MGTDVSPLRDAAEAAVAAAGLVPRGVVSLTAEDGVPALPDGRVATSLLLVGWRGRAGWPGFAGSEERRDGAPDPLDRWSRRVIGAVAAGLGAGALFPFDGPPWWPFQRWAMRAEGLSSSPLGLLIDREVGLWHGWRGALVFAEAIGAEAAPQVSPCETCAQRSCLSACPARAFDGAGDDLARSFSGAVYDVARCRTFLEGHAGGLCRTDGCRSRDACPVGRAHHYAPDQIRFLMSAFRASLSETSSS